MPKAALHNRTYRTLEARADVLQGKAIGSDYPGADLSTGHVATLARALVADLFEVDRRLLLLETRGSRKVAFMRALAIHLTHVVAGRRHEEVAVAFRRNRSTASHHFEVFENLREVAEFDEFLSLLEHRFALLLAASERRPVRAWGKALEAMAHKVNKGELEPDIHFDAKFVVATFKPK